MFILWPVPNQLEVWRITPCLSINQLACVSRRVAIPRHMLHISSLYLQSANDDLLASGEEAQERRINGNKPIHEPCVCPDRIPRLGYPWNSLIGTEISYKTASEPCSLAPPASFALIVPSCKFYVFGRCVTPACFEAATSHKQLFTMMHT